MTILAGNNNLEALHDYWVRTGMEYRIPYFFPVSYSKWKDCFVNDELEGAIKFSSLQLYTSVTKNNEINGFIQLGTPAFAWDKEGHRYSNPSLLIIRHLFFDPSVPEVGETLLRIALAEKATVKEISGFFHIFGMSCNAHHGKLHESVDHVHKLLLSNGFRTGHENVYYSLNFESLKAAKNPLLVVQEQENGSKTINFELFLQDQVIGTAEITIIETDIPDIVYLKWIGIEEQYQGHRFGTFFLSSIINLMEQKGYKQIHTDTPIHNLRAQRYYESLQFLNGGITRDYVF